VIGTNLLTYRQIIFNVPHFENTTLPQVWDPGHERQLLGQETFLELDGKQVTGRIHTLENTAIVVVRRQNPPEFSLFITFRISDGSVRWEKSRKIRQDSRIQLYPFTLVWQPRGSPLRR
jgi:hypothetical protein